MAVCVYHTGETNHLIFRAQGSYGLGYRPSSFGTFLSTALMHFLENTLFEDRLAMQKT